MPHASSITLNLRRIVTALLVISIAIPAGVYAWRYIINPCEVADVQAATTMLKTQVGLYDHLYQVATTAYQNAIDAPLLEMQEVQVDTQEMTVPACMQTTKNELITYMHTVINAFRAWGNGESNVKVQALIKQSDTHYQNFNTELKTVNECAPFCFP